MDGGDSGAVLLELDAARAALERGAIYEAIGHLEVSQDRCKQLVLAPTVATAPAVENDEPLTIAQVVPLTGYSIGRLRHMGHKLPGYKKWPDGKVTWWKRQLLAGIQGNGG